MKARLFLLAIALASFGWQLGFAQEKPDLPAIHVIVVWVNDKSGDIEFTEHAGIAQSADRCGQMTLEEVSPHVKDYKTNAAKWTAHIICGIANEHYVAKAAPDQDNDDPHGSHPGTGGNDPSAPL